LIGDENVQFEVLSQASWEASPVSATDTLLYFQLGSAIRQVFPQAAVGPYLVQGATDARHYTGLSGQVFRFSPYLVTGEDLKTIHGVNEHISLDNLERMAQCYAQVMRAWGGEVEQEVEVESVDREANEEGNLN
jgi:carboxypeptidase PM20D1